MIHPAVIALLDVINLGFIAALCTPIGVHLYFHAYQRRVEADFRHALLTVRASV